MKARNGFHVLVAKDMQKENSSIYHNCRSFELAFDIHCDYRIAAKPADWEVSRIGARLLCSINLCNQQALRTQQRIHYPR